MIYFPVNKVDKESLNFHQMRGWGGVGGGEGLFGAACVLCRGVEPFLDFFVYKLLTLQL